MLQKNCNSIIHLAKLADAHVILVRHFDVESCAKGAFLRLQIVKVLLVGSGPSYDYPGNEDLVQLKECARDVREPISPALVFSAKKIDVHLSRKEFESELETWKNKVLFFLF